MKNRNLKYYTFTNVLFPLSRWVFAYFMYFKINKSWVKYTDLQ